MRAECMLSAAAEHRPRRTLPFSTYSRTIQQVYQATVASSTDADPCIPCCCCSRGTVTYPPCRNCMSIASLAICFHLQDILAKDLSEGQYFVTGNLTREIFADDCRWGVQQEQRHVRAHAPAAVTSRLDYPTSV
jgi:hypothetical protein